MKRRKFTIKVEPKKTRKVWGINPRTRVHDEDSYERSKGKESLRKMIAESEEDDDY